MSFLSNVETDLGIVETDIVNFFATTLPNFEHKVASEVETAATWLVDKALPWLEAHGQEISADVSGLVGIVASLGTGVPVGVLTAATALNSGVQLVNAAIAAAQQSATQQAAAGASVVKEALSAGAAAYEGLKTAQVATSQAQAAVAVAKPAS